MDIDHNISESICTREPEDVVLITAKSNDFGSKLKGIELKAYQKPPLPAYYSVNVYTGNHKDAGTDAGDFFMTLVGSNGRQEFLMDRHDVDDRRVGAIDSYTFEASEDLGDIKQIIVRSNARGRGDDGWLFNKAVVTNESGEKSWEFPCDRWIDSNDGSPLQRTVNAQGCN